MYSSGYSQVSKYSQQAQKKMQHRSEGKSCGYYMRIVFFFSSLIQSLIIVSLVLFLVYGKKQDSASTTRIQDLEESFSRLSIENVALRHQRKNLTNLLNTTMTVKTQVEWDLSKLLHITNISKIIIEDLNRKLQHCTSNVSPCRSPPIIPPFPLGRISPGGCNCGLQIAKCQLVESNFTQTTQRMRAEMEQIVKERDTINLEAIRLRREKSTYEKELQIYRQKCKEDFIQSLSGVSNVSKAFLQKIESIFPTHHAFQLTCQNQRDYLEQIRTNCTSLSREVEDKFQRYLNNVGEQVSTIQAQNSRLKAENWRLSEDYRWCSQNRSGLIQEYRQSFEKLQLKHDKDKEKLLMDKMALNGKIAVLEDNVNYKNKETEHLTEQIKHLNMSCMFKPGVGSFPGIGQHSQPGSYPSFASSGSSVLGQPSRTGSGLGYGSTGSSGTGFNKPGSIGVGSSSYGSTGSSPNLSLGGSGFNKPVSTGSGSPSYGSARSSPSLSSVGSGFNKPVSTGSGSPSYGSTGSSPSLSLNKPATSVRNTPSFASSLGSTGSSPNLSSGSGLNKPGSTGLGSSNYGSTGSSPNLSSGGTGSNKPTSSVKSSPGLGSTGSASKSGSTSSAFSWLGLGNSNTGQSKPGSGTGRGTSSGTGSLFGAGRTSGSGGGTLNVVQHLQDLQRIINPPGPEEKQDLSRMLG